MSILQIDDENFNQIMTCIGAPFIDPNGDELEISADDIKDNIILLALQEYHRYFPLREDFYCAINSAFEIPFPDKYVFTATNCRMTTSRLKSVATGNPLIDERFIRSGSYYGRNIYGTGLDYGFQAARVSMRQENQSWIETTKAFKVRVDDKARKVYGFSNTIGTLELAWLRYSNNWCDVPFQDEALVRKLAQAYVLKYFADLRSADSTPDMPSNFNTDGMYTRAEKLEDEALDAFRDRSSAIVLRG